MYQVKANLYCKSFNKSNENIVVCKLLLEAGCMNTNHVA